MQLSSFNQTYDGCAETRCRESGRRVRDVGKEVAYTERHAILWDKRSFWKVIEYIRSILLNKGQR